MKDVIHGFSDPTTKPKEEQEPQSYWCNYNKNR